MIFDEKINLDQKRIQQELIPFLNKTIDRFGAYSIFTEFWKPDKDDHSAETYKMQILADTIRMNNGLQPLFLENEEDLEFCHLTAKAAITEFPVHPVKQGC